MPGASVGAATGVFVSVSKIKISSVEGIVSFRSVTGPTVGAKVGPKGTEALASVGGPVTSSHSRVKPPSMLKLRRHGSEVAADGPAVTARQMNLSHCREFRPPDLLLP